MTWRAAFRISVPPGPPLPRCRPSRADPDPRPAVKHAGGLILNEARAVRDCVQAVQHAATFSTSPRRAPGIVQGDDQAPSAAGGYLHGKCDSRGRARGGSRGNDLVQARCRAGSIWIRPLAVAFMTFAGHRRTMSNTSARRRTVNNPSASPSRAVARADPAAICVQPPRDRVPGLASGGERWRPDQAIGVGSRGRAPSVKSSRSRVTRP